MSVLVTCLLPFDAIGAFDIMDDMFWLGSAHCTTMPHVALENYRQILA